MADPIVLDAIARGNPVVFFDITIGGVPSGRIKMELFSDETPKRRRISGGCTGSSCEVRSRPGILKHRFIASSRSS